MNFQTPYDRIQFLKAHLEDLEFVRQVAHESGVTQEYFVDQITFLSTLSWMDFEVLTSYTRFGDTIINNVLRGKTPPDIARAFKQIQAKGVVSLSRIGGIQGYVRKFQDLFNKAPRLRTEMVVYRGYKERTDIPASSGYLSTTTNPKIAKMFIHDTCCFTTIHVQPGVRTLWLKLLSSFPDEDEILLGPVVLKDIVEQKKPYRTMYTAQATKGGKKTRRSKV
jgi:hypothetical protein